MSNKYIAVIPAYNPPEAILTVIEQLTSLCFEIIVVNDGSGADYEDIFRECQKTSKVISYIQNKGKGCAIKTGLEYIKNNYGNSAVIVTVDADGQHSAADALRVCDMADKNKGTLILGSRRFRGNVPLRSRVGNAVTRLVYRLSTGASVYDTQTGLRAFSADLIDKLLSVNGERYEYEMNVLLSFSKEKIPIKETEIETIYLNNNSSSHFDTIKDSARIYKEIFKFSASSLIGFAVDYLIYTMLIFTGLNLQLSNIAARIVSASVNYTINRKLVFKSGSKIASSAFQYFLLAIFILFGNTLLLSLLVDSFFINKMAAKIITELIFFAVSWFVQKKIIFRKKGGG